MKIFIKITIACFFAVTAISCSKSGAVPEKIEEPKNENVSPTGINIVSNFSSFTVGEKSKLNYEILPKNATNIDKLEIEWTTSDSKIATINNGEVTAVSVGDVEITATIKGTKIFGKNSLKIIRETPTGLILTLEKPSIFYGEENKILFNIQPATADPKNYIIDWTPLDKLFFEISQDGTVIPLRAAVKGYPRYSTVKATIRGTNISSEIVIDVKKRITFAKVGQEVMMPNGLHLTVTSLNVTDVGTAASRYSINYKLTNKTADKKYTQTYMYLTSKDGVEFSPNAYFATPIFPGLTVTNSNSYEELKNIKMDYFGYRLDSDYATKDEVRVIIE